jgi:hypothetical protein
MDELNFYNKEAYSSHRGYLKNYVKLTPEQIESELRLMYENTKTRNPEIKEDDGYDSEEERQSRLIRHFPNHLLEHTKPIEELTPQEIYDDLNSLRVTSRFPMRYGEVKRQCFVKKYCWASISEAAVDKIAQFVGSRPVLEIGSGSGILAFLLKAKGVNVIATDNYKEMFRFRYVYTNIEKLDADGAIEKYGNLPDLVLMISWGREKMLNAFRKFTGSKYVFIGEPGDGATFCFPEEDVWNKTESLQLSKPYNIDVINEWLLLCDRKTN